MQLCVDTKVGTPSRPHPSVGRWERLRNIGRTRFHPSVFCFCWGQSALWNQYEFEGIILRVGERDKVQLYQSTILNIIWSVRFRIYFETTYPFKNRLLLFSSNTYYKVKKNSLEASETKGSSFLPSFSWELYASGFWRQVIVMLNLKILSKQGSTFLTTLLIKSSMLKW